MEMQYYRTRPLRFLCVEKNFYKWYNFHSKSYFVYIAPYGHMGLFDLFLTPRSLKGP